MDVSGVDGLGRPGRGAASRASVVKPVGRALVSCRSAGGGAENVAGRVGRRIAGCGCRRSAGAVRFVLGNVDRREGRGVESSVSGRRWRETRRARAGSSLERRQCQQVEIAERIWSPDRRIRRPPPAPYRGRVPVRVRASEGRAGAWWFVWGVERAGSPLGARAGSRVARAWAGAREAAVRRDRARFPTTGIRRLPPRLRDQFWIGLPATRR